MIARLANSSIFLYIILTTGHFSPRLRSTRTKHRAERHSELTLAGDYSDFAVNKYLGNSYADISQLFKSSTVAALCQRQWVVVEFAEWPACTVLNGEQHDEN